MHGVLVKLANMLQQFGFVRAFCMEGESRCTQESVSELYYYFIRR